MHMLMFLYTQTHTEKEHALLQMNLVVPFSFFWDQSTRWKYQDRCMRYEYNPKKVNEDKSNKSLNTIKENS